jgi:glycosidase
MTTHQPILRKHFAPLLRPLLALAALLAGYACAAQTQAPSPITPAAGVPALERVEPPFWWAGMKSSALQLMVHGDGIGRFTPRLSYPGVSLQGTEKASNPNYLFVNLRLSPQAKPGAFDIVFQHGPEQRRYRYELRRRAPGSAQRQGFGNADVILNLMPDRFANGNPANDEQPGYADKLNRADDSAGRHGGDIQGIIDHLDYIAAMGYTALWPTPLTESNQPLYSYHGYAATNTYRVDPRYGSNDDYLRLVAAAKQKGIKVIQDIVLNHIGSGHWWMRDMPMADWLTHGGQFVPTNHARTAIADPYAAQVDKDSFTTGWFEPAMPDMNQANPLVATYQIQNSIWWVEYAGLAGIREDTYGYADTAFLAQWSRRLLQEYPNLNMVGEEWSNNPVVVAHWLRGAKNRDGYVSNLPSVMDYPLFYTLRQALTAKDSLHSGLTDLYEALVNDTLYPQPQNLVLFEGNHDVGRIYSALDEDLALYKMALVYLATMRRIPQFYYGTEILMTSPKERDDGAFRKDFPGGWPGDTVNAFTGAGLTPKQLEAQAFVKKLLSWRKTQPVIHHGQLLHYAPENGTYVYFRYDGKAKVMVVFNKNTTDTPLPTARFAQMLTGATTGTDVLSGQAYDLKATNITVPARSATVLELR